jgi:hypothetical protein
VAEKTVILSPQVEFHPLVERQPFNEADNKMLNNLLTRRRMFTLSTYGGLSGIIIVAFFKSYDRFADHGEILLFNRVSLYFYPIVFLALTGYFIKYYLDEVHTFEKDIKLQQKESVTFHIVKYQMPFFNHYYIKSPLEQKQVVEVSAETYRSIPEKGFLTFDIAKHSETILRLRLMDTEILFY